MRLTECGVIYGVGFNNKIDMFGRLVVAWRRDDVVAYGADTVTAQKDVRWRQRRQSGVRRCGGIYFNDRSHVQPTRREILHTSLGGHQLTP